MRIRKAVAKSERKPTASAGRRSRLHVSRFTFHGSRLAFTLLEVMIAAGILFVCLFAILGLLGNTLRNARALQTRTVDAGMLAAELSLTNRLYEGTDSGDFGNLYPDYRWTRDTTMLYTNGFFEVNFTVIHRTRERSTESHMTVYMYRPDSPVTAGGGGMGRR